MQRRFQFHRWMLRGHPDNVVRGIRRIVVRGHNHELVVTSTTDGSHSPTSFHFTEPGRAVDLGNAQRGDVGAAPGTPKARQLLVKFQRDLIRKFGCESFLELFGPDNSLNCRNGRRATLDEGSALETLHDTHDHVVPARLLPLPEMGKAARRRLQLAKSRRKARRAGARYTALIQKAAEKHNISYPLALALVWKESNFVNQYGHDVACRGCLPIWHGRLDRVLVTRENVQRYLAWALRHGARQGVGLTQLTSASFQQAAELRGGLDKPAAQLDVGLQILAGHIKALGKRSGIGAFNGGRGNPQLAYADAVIAREEFYRSKGVK